MTKKLMIFVMIILCSANAYAWDASQYASSWGVPSGWDTCGAMYLGEGEHKFAAIGPERLECAINDSYDFEECIVKNNPCKVGGNAYVRGFSMLIARELNENGAYLCPTIIGGDKSGGWEWSKVGWDKPYITRYYEVSSSASKNCFWLCKSGYSGEGCQETTVSSCNLNTVKQANFDGEEFSVQNSVRDVEDSVAMFVAGHKERCEGKSCRSVRCSPREHDMVLGVIGWLPSEHGVKVQPFIVRAGYDPSKVQKQNNSSNSTCKGGYKGWNYGPGRVVAYAVGTQTLLCASGYEPNFNNSDCIPVDESLCAVTEAMESDKTCNAKNASYASLDAFDSSTMELHYFDTDGCQGIICSQAGYGFDPNNIVRPTCIDCGMDDDVRNGIDKYGRCVRCDVGQIFNRMSSKCVPATVLDWDRLKFGPGKSASTPIIEQCWTQPDQYSYSDCVWAKTTSNTNTAIRVTGVYSGGLATPIVADVDVATVADGN